MNNFSGPCHCYIKYLSAKIIAIFPKLDKIKKCDMLFMHKSIALRLSILCRNTREYMRSESHSAIWLGDFFYLKYSKSVSKLFQKWYNVYIKS